MTPSKSDEAQEDGPRVDRGQRVRREMELHPAHDGKERTLSARPKRSGVLPADMTNAAAKRVTTEDVVEVEENASAWEALDDETD